MSPVTERTCPRVSAWCLHRDCSQAVWYRYPHVTQSSHTGVLNQIALDRSADTHSKYQVWENGQAGETQYITSTVEKK